MTNFRSVVISSILFTSISCGGYKYSTYEFQPEIEFKDINGQQKVVPSSYVRKYITFESDSTLNYTTLIGDIGKSTKIKYKIIGDSLKIANEDYYGRRTVQGYNSKEIYATHIPYNSDSLFVNNEKYYSRTYLENLKNKNFNEFYLIINDRRPQRVTIKNRDKISKKLKNHPITSKAEIIDPDISFNKYNIDKKYLTIKIITEN